MIKLLRRNQQVFILFIFVYAVISVFSILITNQQVKSVIISNNLPLLTGFISNLIANSKVYFLFTLLIFLLVLTIGFYLVRISIKYLIIPNRTQFAALFYLAIASFGYMHAMFSEAILGSLFLLFAIDRIFGTIKNKELSYRYLDAGILLAMGSMFYFNIIFLVPFLFLSQLTLRSHHRKELLLILIGSIIPYIYLISVYFILGKPVENIFIGIKEWVITRNVSEYNWQFLSALGFYALMILIASIFAISKFAVTKIQVRKLYQIFFYLFFNIVAIYLLVPAAGDEVYFLIAIPLSALLSVFYAECRNNIPNNILLVLLISIPLLVNILR
jgi:hypothetical protein